MCIAVCGVCRTILFLVMLNSTAFDSDNSSFFYSFQLKYHLIIYEKCSNCFLFITNNKWLTKIFQHCVLHSILSAISGFLHVFFGFSFWWKAPINKFTLSRSQIMPRQYKWIKKTRDKAKCSLLSLAVSHSHLSLQDANFCGKCFRYWFGFMRNILVHFFRRISNWAVQLEFSRWNIIWFLVEMGVEWTHVIFVYWQFNCIKSMCASRKLQSVKLSV